MSFLVLSDYHHQAVLRHPDLYAILFHKVVDVTLSESDISCTGALPQSAKIYPKGCSTDLVMPEHYIKGCFDDKVPRRDAALKGILEQTSYQYSTDENTEPLLQ